jgi:hypothetical protein
VSLDGANPSTGQAVSEDGAKPSAALREQESRKLRAGDLMPAIDLLGQAGTQDPDDPHAMALR